MDNGIVMEVGSSLKFEDSGRQSRGPNIFNRNQIRPQFYTVKPDPSKKSQGISSLPHQLTYVNQPLPNYSHPEQPHAR